MNMQRETTMKTKLKLTNRESSLIILDNSGRGLVKHILSPLFGGGRLGLLYMLILFSFSLSAQEKDAISKDVKVVKAYSPSLSDAFKMNRMPVLNDSISLNTEFKYSILSKAMITGYNIEPITPAKIARERMKSLKSSYLRAGIGNYNSLFGDLNYNILQSESFVLGLDIGHITSLGNLVLENDTKVDAPFHDTWGDVGFNYLFDEKTLYADINFKHNIYNYYGYETMNSDQSYFVPGYTDTIPQNLLQPNKKQRLSGIDFRLGFKNNEIRDDRLSYDMSIGYSSFSNLTGVLQNGFDIGGSAYFPIGTVGLNVDVDIRNNNTSVPDSIGPLYYFQQRKNTLIGISPKMVFIFDRAKVNVGLLLYGELDSFEDQFQIAPVLTGELTIVEGVVSMEGGMKGHYHQNDYRTVQYENPFVSPDQNIKTAFYGLDVFTKIKGNFSKSTSFSAYASYAMFMNEHFWVNKFYLYGTVSDFNFHYSNQFVPVYDDGSLLTVSGELLYQPNEKFNLLTKATYYGWNTDSLTQAWHKPEMELMVNSRFSPVKDLWIDAGFNVLGKRYAFDPTAIAQKRLDAVFDLNIGAEYNYNSVWSFFARVNNLAASKYYKWNGYPMQGVNVHVGVGISF